MISRVISGRGYDLWTSMIWPRSSSLNKNRKKSKSNQSEWISRSDSLCCGSVKATVSVLLGVVAESGAVGSRSRPTLQRHHSDVQSLAVCHWRPSWPEHSPISHFNTTDNWTWKWPPLTGTSCRYCSVTIISDDKCVLWVIRLSLSSLTLSVLAAS